MRSLIALAFALALSGVASTASAQWIGSYPFPPNVTRSSWCSATTQDGTWAVYYTPYDVFATCEYVRNDLAYRTYAPVASVQRGYFFTNRVVTAAVQCGYWSQRYTGLGTWPLQQAYDWARAVNGRHCLFSVY